MVNNLTENDRASLTLVFAIETCIFEDEALTKVLPVLSKKDAPESFIVLFFTRTCIFLLREVKPSPDNKMTKLNF